MVGVSHSDERTRNIMNDQNVEIPVSEIMKLLKTVLVYGVNAKVCNTIIDFIGDNDILRTNAEITALRHAIDCDNSMYFIPVASSEE